MKKNPAFTIIELLVALALVVGVAVPSLFAFREIRQKQALSATTESLVSVLKTAHIYARESKENKSWGVKYKDATSYNLVSGDLNNWSAVGEFGLEDPVSFETSGFTVWFDQGTGGTAENVSVVVITPTGVRAEVNVSVNGIEEAR